MKITGMFITIALGVMMMMFNGLNIIQVVIASLFISMATLLLEEIL